MVDFPDESFNVSHVTNDREMVRKAFEDRGGCIVKLSGNAAEVIEEILKDSNVDPPDITITDLIFTAVPQQDELHLGGFTICMSSLTRPNRTVSYLYTTFKEALSEGKEPRLQADGRYILPLLESLKAYGIGVVYLRGDEKSDPTWLGVRNHTSSPS